jgi:glycosyltransferase involved in cell wall biosynthesis
VKIAYLINTYPVTSSTFIRREIAALERLGVGITRYAVRRWTEALVDPDDIAEQARTHFLLTGNLAGLFLALARAAVTRPVPLMRGVAVWLGMLAGARGDLVRQAAYLLQAVYLRQRAAADGIDHIHVHFATNATTVAMLARLMGGPSYSFTVHGPDEFVDVGRIGYDAKIRRAAFVIAISDFCKSQLIRFSTMAHWDKIHVARCGVDLALFEPAPPCAAGNRTLVCVGRLCPQKGQALIPRAAAALRADFPDLKVILVGDGESRSEVEAEIARAGVGDLIEVRGWVANPQVRELIAGARALLLPSFAEGLPVVIMETFALGRPAISTHVAGIPELVDASCGWLIPAGSGEALTAAMGEALSASPEDLSRMGNAARARVARLHDLGSLAETLRGHFQAACA